MEVHGRNLPIHEVAANSRDARRDITLSPSTNIRPRAVQQLNFDNFLRLSRPTNVTPAMAITVAK